MLLSGDGAHKPARRDIWLAVTAVILFAMLAVAVMAGVSAGLEGWAYGEVAEHISPTFTGAVRVVTHAGDPAAVIIFCLLLIAIPKSRRTIALPVSVAVIMSTGLNNLLKDIFARERPDILRLVNETNYSFPSGHAMINMTLYAMLAFLAFAYVKNRPLKYTLAALCALAVAAIGYSRVYLGVHYAGDVLGGWLIGFAVAAIVHHVWRSRVYNAESGG